MILHWRYCISTASEGILELFRNWTMPDLRGNFPQDKEAPTLRTRWVRKEVLTQDCEKLTAKLALASFGRGLI